MKYFSFFLIVCNTENFINAVSFSYALPICVITHCGILLLRSRDKKELASNLKLQFLSMVSSLAQWLEH